MMALKDTMANDFQSSHIYCNEDNAPKEEHGSVPLGIVIQPSVENTFENGHVEDIKDPGRSHRNGIIVAQVESEICRSYDNMGMAGEDGAIGSAPNDEKDPRNGHGHSNCV